MKKTYTVNNEPCTNYEYHITKKLCVIIYTKCKNRTKKIEVLKDRYFGTGTTIIIYSKH